MFSTNIPTTLNKKQKKKSKTKTTTTNKAKSNVLINGKIRTFLRNASASDWWLQLDLKTNENAEKSLDKPYKNSKNQTLSYR